MNISSADTTARIAEIRRLLGSVPPRYPLWYYEQTVAFKKIAREAARAIEARAPNADTIERCARALRRAFES